MIRNDAKYQNGKIYKITDMTTGAIYIGSTTQELSRRLSNHVTDYKRWKDGKRTRVTSCEIIKNNNYMITLLEAFPCNNRYELDAKEGEYIMANDCINRHKAGVSDAEKREYSRRYTAEYRIKNREAIRIKKNTYVQCPCGTPYTVQHRARHKKSQRHINWEEAQKE